MIDWTRVTELMEEVGLDAFDEIAAMFVTEMDEAVDRMVRDGPTLAGLHFVKGAALNLGLTDLSLRAESGEARAEAGGDPGPEFGGFADIYAASRAALLAGLPGNEGLAGLRQTG